MPELEIPFRQWLPDQPDLNNPGLVEAKNVVSTPLGYNPLNGAGTPDGSATAFGWTRESRLYRYNYTTNGVAETGFLFYEDSFVYHLDADGVSQSSLLMTALGGTGNADFARFGNAIYFTGVKANAATSTIATSIGKFDLVTKALTKTLGTDYKGGGTIARVGNFLMSGGIELGNLDLSPYGFKWSAFNDPDTFGVSDLTQSGSAQIETPYLGRITAIVGGRFPMIFQKKGITRIDYVGPPKVWAQKLISDRQGASEPSAIVRDDDLYYFMNATGVFVTNGVSVDELSKGRVSRWIRSKTKSYEWRINGAYHPDVRAIVWCFETPDDVVDDDPWPFFLVYALDTGEFTYGDGPTYGAARGETGEVKITGGPANSTQYSIVPQAGDPADAKLVPLDGDAMEATLTTGHISNAGRRAFVDQVEPQYIGSGATVALSAKDRLRDDASFSAYVAEETTTGIADIRADGRAVALSVKFPAASDWSDFTGVVADASEAGKR